MNKNLFTFAIFLLMCSVMSAQSLTISGRVTDEDTQEGLPFCNVYFAGTTIGASTDIDGYYTLTTKNPSDTLVASAIGYTNLEKILRGKVDQTINFAMSSSELMLSEVVVVAGENPANEIVRNIIKNKDINRRENLDAFQCESYSKMELDMKNIGEKMRNSKIFKPFKFIFENIDSTSDEKPFLPVYITEKVNEVFYDKEIGDIREVPKAQRVSGVENQSAIEFIARIHQDFSVYDNWISILEKPFISPFAKSGLGYYEYYIIDSSHIENKWSYKLKFKPKRKQENTFYGDFWVADSTFAIQRVNMRMSTDANINLVSRVIIYQDFNLHHDSLWLPYTQKMVVDFSPAKKAPGMIGRRTLSYKDYKINHEETATIFQEEAPSYIPMETLEKEDDYWNEARHQKLTKNEAAIYAMIDSVKNVPMYKTYMDILYTLVTGYKELGNIEIGPYFSIYSSNPVEGNRFKMGAWTSNKFSKRIRFGGYLAYGTKDNRFKYGGDFQLNISKYPWIVVGGAYRNDVDLGSSNSEEIGEGNLISGIYRRPIVQKLLHTKESKLFYERYGKKGWSGRVTFLHRQMDPYGRIEDDGGGFNYQYLPNPETSSLIDTTITATEFIFKARYAFDEKFLEGNFTRSSLGSKKPIIEMQYTLGVKGLLGSEHSYHKLTLGLRHYFYLNPIGWTSYRFKAGKVIGTIPFLLMEVHPGNETYFYSKNAFNGMNRYEFASDTYATLMVEHHFDGFILNKFPLLRKLKWRTVASFKAVWGTLSDDNKDANRLNNFSSADLSTYTGFRAPSGVPYMESGIGIENIFKVIRLDLLWRLNYQDNPEAQTFTFRAGLDFYF